EIRRLLELAGGVDIARSVDGDAFAGVVARAAADLTRPDKAAHAIQLDDEHIETDAAGVQAEVRRSTEIPGGVDRARAVHRHPLPEGGVRAADPRGKDEAAVGVQLGDESVGRAGESGSEVGDAGARIEIDRAVKAAGRDDAARRIDRQAPGLVLAWAADA